MTEPHADEKREEAPRPPGEQPPDTTDQGSQTGSSTASGEYGVPEQRREPSDTSGEHSQASEKATRQGESAAPDTAMPAEQERDWALAAHLGSFLAAYVALGFLCPLVVLLAKGKASPYVRHHAIESLNFQLTALGAAIVAGLLAFVYVGLILLPFIVIGYIVLVIMAGIAAYRGELYRYPVTLRMIN
jgi:uncharacterized protein